MELAEDGVLPSCRNCTKGTGTKGAMGTEDTSGTEVPCNYPREGRRDPLELTPNSDQAKFIALGAQLVIIRDLCQQDLRFKVRPEERLTQYKQHACFYLTGFTRAAKPKPMNRHSDKTAVLLPLWPLF